MPGVSDTQKQDAERILAAVGTTFWVGSERDLDAVTAVSGSGPAYVFYFIEALEQAALELGLPAETARQSALATFAGAVKLALADSADPATLRARVTSKGGTTERAIGLLDQAAVKAAFVRAVRGAAERADELGDELGKD
jgi:pyrroline-5-carboxylate reductase